MMPTVTPTQTMTPTPAPSHIVVDLWNHGGNAGSGGSPWVVPLITGTFLIVVALVTFLATRSNDDRKATRDHATRWHDEIRNLSADAIAAARAIHDLSTRQTSFYSVPDPDDQPEADKRIDAIQAKVDDEYAKLLHTQGGLNLVAPASITGALLTVVTAAHNVMIANEHQAKDARDALRPTITTFIEANRTYLEITD